MWLVRLALRRPITVVVLALAIMLSAWLAIRRAPVNIFPNLGIPVIYVVQPYVGMSPSQMESYFVTYYEYHFLYIAGLERVSSRRRSRARRCWNCTSGRGLIFRSRWRKWSP